MSGGFGSLLQAVSKPPAKAAPKKAAAKSPPPRSEAAAGGGYGKPPATPTRPIGVLAPPTTVFQQKPTTSGLTRVLGTQQSHQKAAANKGASVLPHIPILQTYTSGTQAPASHGVFGPLLTGVAAGIPPPGAKKASTAMIDSIINTIGPRVRALESGTTAGGDNAKAGITRLKQISNAPDRRMIQLYEHAVAAKQSSEPLWMRTSLNPALNPQARPERSASQKADDQLATAAIAPAPIETLGLPKPVAKRLEGYLQDAANIEVGLPQLALAGGAAAVDAAKHGNLKAFEQLGLGIVDSTVHTFEHPLKSFESAPFSTAFILGAPFVKAGEIAAKIGARRAGPPEPAPEPSAPFADAGMTAGHPYTTPPEPARDLSPLVQKLIEKNPKRNIARAIEHNVVGTGARAGLVDKYIGLSESFRRTYHQTIDKMIGESKPSKEAMALDTLASMHATGVVRRADTIHEDLTAELDRLQANRGKLVRRADLKQNAENIKAIKTILAEPDLYRHAAEQFHTGNIYRDLMNHELEPKLVELGELKPEQVRAKYMDYALRHMPIHWHPGGDESVGAAHLRDLRKIETQASAAARATGDKIRSIQVQREVTKEAIRVRKDELRPVAGVTDGADLRLAADREKLKALNGDLRAARADHKVTRAAYDEATSIRYAHQEHVGKGGMTRPAGLRYNNTNEPVPTEDIQAHLGAHNVPEPAYMGNMALTDVRGNFTGAGSGLRRKASAANGPRRTGFATLHGTNERTWEAMRAQLLKSANKAGAHGAANRNLSRFVLAEEGGHDTPESAQGLADRLNMTPEGEKIAQALGEFKVVTIGPKNIQDAHVVYPSSAAEVLAAAGEDMAAGKAATHHYGVMPAKVAARFEEHNRLMGSSKPERLMQKATNAFRNTNLFTTIRWPIGVAQEAAIRNLFSASGVRSAILGNLAAGRLKEIADMPLDKIEQALGFDKLDPAEARQRAVNAKHGAEVAYYGAASGGTHVDASRVVDIVRKLNRDFDEATAGLAVKGGFALRNSAAGHQAVAAWEAYKAGVSAPLTRVEQLSRTAAFGKAVGEDMRRYASSERKAIRAQGDLLNDYVRGLVIDRARVEGLMNHVDEVLGEWNKLPPAVKKMRQTWLPFGLWYINSVRFIGRLPFTHPGATGIAAAYSQSDNAKKFRESIKGKGYLAATAKINLPFVGDVNLNPVHYSPFDIGVDPGQVALSQIDPAGLGDAGRILLAGKDFLLQDIKNPDGSKINTEQRIEGAGNALASGFAPWYRGFQTVLEKGGRPLPTASLPGDIAHTLGLGASQVERGTERGLLKGIIKYVSPVPFYFAPRSGTTAPAPPPSSPKFDASRFAQPTSSNGLTAEQDALASKLLAGNGDAAGGLTPEKQALASKLLAGK